MCKNNFLEKLPLMNKEKEDPHQKSYPIYRSGIGQDSHRFLPENSSKPCILGGIIFEEVPGLDADSDGDVIFHSICNAISSVTGVPILGNVAKELCKKDGITDSQVYLEEAIKTLKNQKIIHLALSIEAKKPYFESRIDILKMNISKILGIEMDQIGITATSGDGLTDFGCGRGLQCFCLITTMEIKS
jgi:2-C-methyl-D-erythritol 2,4-cyclodiphosphate synthase